MDPVSCFKCWWADYNPDTDNHDIVEEPDILNMKSPTDPTTIRVIQKCGIGERAWKVNPHQNWCPKHADFEVMKRRQQKLRGQIQEAGASEFDCRTGRVKIPNNASMFVFLEKMTEDSSLAFDFLTDCYMILGDADMGGCLELFGRLNDMNIRGRQIDVIIERYFPEGVGEESLFMFRKLLNEKPQEVVDYINKNFDKADDEEAVVEGASIYGHA